MSQIPAVGRIVHYVSFGTPNGEYPKACCAAQITEVDDDTISAVVFYPNGLSFKTGLVEDATDDPDGGTYHWPERVG